MKTTKKILVACLSAALLLGLCSCGGGGGGIGGIFNKDSNSSSSGNYTNGTEIAHIKAESADDHWFSFFSDGVVVLFDNTQAGAHNKLGDPWKKGTFDKTKNPLTEKFEFTLDGKTVEVNAGTITYACECGEKTYKKE